MLFSALYVLSFPGHLAARGDFIYANEQRSTFNYINVAPQVSSMTIPVSFSPHIKLIFPSLNAVRCNHHFTAKQQLEKRERRMANWEREKKQVLISLFVIRMEEKAELFIGSGGKEGKKRRTKTNIAKNNIQIQSHEVSGSVVPTTLYTQLT